MLPLRCFAQNYEWGRPAGTSEVAQLAGANGSCVDESRPYAELWMGTHPNCPSVVAASGQSLSSWIDQHPESLGQAVQLRFGSQLPFLFKVLSVSKALSIQSHPDKQLAERLRRDHPQIYADDNHKPEMALALSDGFEALCSFAPLPEIMHALQAQPELAELVGPSAVAALQAAATRAMRHAKSDEAELAEKQALRTAFTTLMQSPADAVHSAVARLVARLLAKQQQQQGASSGLADKEALALRLDQQYPGGDVGVLSCFFLNLIKLRRGEAIYLAANEPHAYLAGELMECMAASDNVIRAGLTPKFKHTDVLCSSLTYVPGMPEVLQGRPHPLPAQPGHTHPGSAPGQAPVTAQLRVYQPPFEEFEMRSLVLAPHPAAPASASLPSTTTSPAAGSATTQQQQQQPASHPGDTRPPASCSPRPPPVRVVVPVDPGPQILMVQGGCGRATAECESVSRGAAAGLQSVVELRRGSILFVPARTHVSLTLSSEEPLQIWVAAVNSAFFQLVEAVADKGPMPVAQAAALKAIQQQHPAPVAMLHAVAV